MVLLACRADWLSLLLLRGKALVDVAERARYNTTGLPRLAAAHGVRLSRTCLTITEYRSIIALQAVVNDWLGHFVEYILLLGVLAKDLREFEVVALF